MSIEYKWFNVVKRSIDLVEDSIIFGIENPFMDTDLNLLLDLLRRSVRSGMTLKTSLKTSWSELLTRIPKSQLRATLRSYIGSEMDFKSYEEQLHDSYGKRVLQSLGDKLVHCGQENNELPVIVDDVKNAIDLIDGTSASASDISKDKAVELIHEKWMKISAGDYSDYIKTGLSSLDDIIIGMERSKHMIIGARPSIGKTALGLSIQNNTATNGYKTGFISVETIKQSLMERLAHINSEVPSDVFTSPEGVSQTDFNDVTGSLEMIRTNENFIVESTNNRTMSDVSRIARKMKRDNPDLEIIIVDYLQKIQANNTSQPKHIQIEDNCGALTDLGKVLNVRMITLAQLNRESEKAEKEVMPMLHNFEGSSAVEKDADIAVLIHRSRKGAFQASVNGTTEVSVFNESGTQSLDALDTMLIVAKNRDGKTGLAKCSYNARCTKFFDLDECDQGRYGGF